MCLPRTLSFVFVATWSAALAAQTTTVVTPPQAADGEQTGSFNVQFDDYAFRYHQAWPMASIGVNGGQIDAMSFRIDASPVWAPHSFAPTTLQGTTIVMSWQPTRLEFLGPTYAFNYHFSAPPTVTVFQGDITLPARAPLTAPGPSQWITIPFSTPFVLPAGVSPDDVLLVDITGQGAGHGGPQGTFGGPVGYLFDSVSHAPTPGAILPVGPVTGIQLSASGQVLPGDTLSIESRCAWTAATFVGFQRFPQPVDLGLIGAPGQWLHFQPVAQLPQSNVLGHHLPCNLFSVAELTIPARDALTGLKFYVQSIATNGMFGLPAVTSNALEFTVGARAPYASRCFFGSSAEPVAEVQPLQSPVVKFDGTFL